MFEPSEVEERLSLPLALAINYKSDLTSTGAGSFARFYATVRRLYQGQNLDQDLIVEIPLSSGWAEGEEELIEVVGVAIFYNLYIHLYKVTGTLLIDNIRATHSGQNWVRDPFCKKDRAEFRSWLFSNPPPLVPDDRSFLRKLQINLSHIKNHILSGYQIAVLFSVFFRYSFHPAPSFLFTGEALFFLQGHLFSFYRGGSFLSLKALFAPSF